MQKSLLSFFPRAPCTSRNQTGNNNGVASPLPGLNGTPVKINPVFPASVSSLMDLKNTSAGRFHDGTERDRFKVAEITPSSQTLEASSNSLLRMPASDVQPMPEVKCGNHHLTGKRKRVIVESSDEENECGVETPSMPKSKLPDEPNSDLKPLKLSAFFCSTLDSAKSIPCDLQSTKSSGPCVFKDTFEEQPTTWEHLRLAFLKTEAILDASKRRPGDPDFDSKTLYVPQEFLVKQSPAMRQWWELKSKYADVLLFFKVGKFYELYHMDAVIAVEQLGLVFMKGAYAHCGFPEVAFQRMADILVKKGYKVGRVEQTESVDAMSERTKGKPSSEKVVRREICQLVCPGTCTASSRTDICSTPSYSESDDFNVFKETEDANRSILLALCEHRANVSSGELIFGVAILDASNGKIIFGQFPDDRHCSRLRTLLSQFVPSQLLVERNLVSRAVKSLLQASLSGIPVEYLASGKQFWTAKNTITELETADYFKDIPEPENVAYIKYPGKQNWPKAILNTLSEDDPLRRSVMVDSELAVRSLGAVVYYLRYCLLDRQVLSLGYFEEYHPPDITPTIHKEFTGNYSPPFYSFQSSLIIDGTTLANLDVLRNSSTGTREGTLLERLDTCCTAFGRRLLRQWLAAPPCNPNIIRTRQDAVGDLIGLKDSILEVRESLRRLPDLERLITKMHLLGSRGKDKTHPDNRAVIFEELQYSRKNLTDFAATLDGLESACNLRRSMARLAISSKYLRHLMLLKTDGGQFPSLESQIQHFKSAFNVEKAKQDGRVIPEPGIDPSYDNAIRELTSLQTELDHYLLECGKILGSRLSYWGTGRNRYQIEVPESLVSRVPTSWQLASQRKGAKRYRTIETTNFLARMLSAEDRRDACLRSITHTIFASFSQSFSDWLTATRCLAELDCLVALSTYSMNISSDSCRPELVDLTHTSSQPFLEIVDGFHPCLTNTFNGGDLIPNSVYLGSSKPRTILVTGPNMGGKSTLLRQTALLVILSHMGCLVPAKACRLTPVDRIFSRLGASDRLLAGESTFMVELSETAAILRHVSPHSLVLMDELGRGTSTHDGTALAGAVLRFLADPPAHHSGSSCGPRTLFSTHYHSLVDDVAMAQKIANESIGLGHMACMVEEQNDTDLGLANITFLYKFIPGACPKSYGFNAARLAHLPDAIIQAGLVKAKEFERASSTLSCLQNILEGTLNAEQARKWIIKLKAFI